MLNLLNDFAPRLALHAGILALGLATFVGLILYSQCPRCGWLEWISGREDADDTEEAPAGRPAQGSSTDSSSAP